MKIAVFGGTGYAGGAIATELESRGHEVVRIARTGTSSGVVEGSVHDGAALPTLTAGAEVIVVAVPASDRRGHQPLVEAIPALTELVAATGQRVGIVGGAGGLRAEPGGPRLFQQPGFPETILPEAQAQAGVAQALEASDESVDWFYVRPSRLFGAFAPGERKGTYRIGHDVLLVAEDGESSISGADFAAAFADEIEKPAHRRRAFTVGY